MSEKTSENFSSTTSEFASLPTLTVAPKQVMRGFGILAQVGDILARFGRNSLIIGGDSSLEVTLARLKPALTAQEIVTHPVSYRPDCSEASLARLMAAVEKHQADFIIGTGGGKSLDMAKLVAHRCNLPVVTIPSSAATCAAWTALSNIYSDRGAFLYDVPLDGGCPDLLILDYELIATAPKRTLVAGIGDAIAKWYEASVSSGHSEQTLLVAAVQQARVLRDILLQKSAAALEQPGSEVWREVVDATVLLAGAIGGLGGAQCRTVGAHAVHNGLTHVDPEHHTLHGEKVAYGILVQLRLEEMVQNNQLAATARQQLLKFYGEIGLPATLDELGLENITLKDLKGAAEISCGPNSDIHRLPFPVVPDQLLAAMVSTTATVDRLGNSQSVERVGIGERELSSGE